MGLGGFGGAGPEGPPNVTEGAGQAPPPTGCLRPYSLPTKFQLTTVPLFPSAASGSRRDYTQKHNVHGCDHTQTQRFSICDGLLRDRLGAVQRAGWPSAALGQPHGAAPQHREQV